MLNLILVKFKGEVKLVMLLIFLFILATITSSCNKYKEDPFYSPLKTARKRLEGQWKVIYFEVNKVDSTTNYYANSRFPFYAEIQEVKHTSSDEYFKIHDGNGRHDSSVSFELKKHGIIEMTNWLVYPYNSHVFTILKLYKKDWWLAINMNNKDYIIKLKWQQEQKRPY
jgi:hypothetical protein